MRRTGLLITSLFLACGASLALAAPASAAVQSNSGHPHGWYCDDNGYYHGYGYGHYGYGYYGYGHGGYGYYHGGIFIGIGYYG